MIGLDTNVLVRYLTQDDPDQSPRANRIIEAECSKDAPARVTLVVLCELVWILRGAYGYHRTLIVSALEGLLASAELEIEAEEIARRAVKAYSDGPADFADYVILFSNRVAGCQRTYTFDQKLASHDAAATP